jgi:hypothetical protein
LWHGANWTFVIWGGIHGCGLALERLIAGRHEAASARGVLAVWLRRILIFNVVCLAWIFFREPSLHGAFDQLAGLASWEWQPVYGVALLFLTVFAGLLLALDLQLESAATEYLFADRSLHLRVAVGVLFCVLITLLGANQANAFIYFRF